MKRAGVIVLTLALMWAWAAVLWADSQSVGRPNGFVNVEELIPDVRVDLRYCSSRNFVGDRIRGYLAPRALLTKQAAEALKRVQEELRTFGLGLKIYDAYRPQRAVDHFVRWAQDPGDKKTKCEYYPNVQKENLFKEGYIAVKSGHSRGSAVDLTIVSLKAADDTEELDMGTPFDFFGPESWPTSAAVSPTARGHRLLLRMLMEKHGFESYDKEWWHFVLRNEPFPQTYFDFTVE